MAYYSHNLMIPLLLAIATIISPANGQLIVDGFPVESLTVYGFLPCDQTEKKPYISCDGGVSSVPNSRVTSLINWDYTIEVESVMGTPVSISDPQCAVYVRLPVSNCMGTFDYTGTGVIRAKLASFLIFPGSDTIAVYQATPFYPPRRSWMN